MDSCLRAFAFATPLPLEYSSPILHLSSLPHPKIPPFPKSLHWTLYDTFVYCLFPFLEYQLHLVRECVDGFKAVSCT